MSASTCTLICYASGKFIPVQRHLVRTARRVGGLRKVRAFGPDDVAAEYRRRFAHIFEKPRGGGYWLWKPYLVCRQIESSRDGDVVFYCDSGSHFVSSAAPLLETLAREPHGILSFDLTHPEGRYTKRLALSVMGMDTPAVRASPQRLSSFVLFRVSPETRRFAREWLELCQDERLLTDLPNPPDLPEYCDFADHRHDQSLFSLLCKREGVPGYPDPSQWGNDDPRRPSLYPQVLEHTRGAGFTPPPSPLARLKHLTKRVICRLR